MKLMVDMYVADSPKTTMNEREWEIGNDKYFISFREYRMNWSKEHDRIWFGPDMLPLQSQTKIDHDAAGTGIDENHREMYKHSKRHCVCECVWCASV